jgi:hypothetical protein
MSKCKCGSVAWFSCLVPFGHARSTYAHPNVHAARFRQPVTMFTYELRMNSGNSKLYFGRDQSDQICLTELAMHCQGLKGLKSLSQ